MRRRATNGPGRGATSFIGHAAVTQCTDACQRDFGAARAGTELRKPQSHRTNRTPDSRRFAAGPLHFAARSSRTLRATPETGANEGSDGCRTPRDTTALDALTEGWRLPEVNAAAECNG